MLTLLTSCNQLLIGLCKALTIALVGTITGVVGASVVWRYGLNNALVWAEEIAKYLMVWMTFTAAPIALRQGGHVAIEIIPNLLPTRLRFALLGLVFLSVAVLMAVWVYYGSVFAWNGRRQMIITFGDVSMLWVFAAMPCGSAVMLLVAAELALRNAVGAIWPDAYRPPPGAAAAAPRPD